MFNDLLGQGAVFVRSAVRRNPKGSKGPPRIPTSFQTKRVQSLLKVSGIVVSLRVPLLHEPGRPGSRKPSSKTKTQLKAPKRSPKNRYQPDARIVARKNQRKARKASVASRALKKK